MAEKQCKYCAMMIPREARICPHCRKRQGWTLPAKIGLGIIIIIVIFGIIPELFGPSPSQKYTKEQKKAAEDIHKIFIDSGLIVEFKSGNGIQIVYVDKMMWNAGTYENKKEILGKLSETNEILGYTPWIEIRDYHSGKVYGALKPPLTKEIYE